MSSLLWDFAINQQPRGQTMKSLITLSLLSLSLSSFAGTIRMVGTGECSSTESLRISSEAQQAELTKCAESLAHSDLSKKCEGRGNGWLLESEIARRSVKSSIAADGRTMSVSAMAVGRCEF
jgi:hypothetical protein